MLENVIFEIQEGELHEYDDSVSTYYNSSSVSSLHSSQYSTDSTRIREGNLIDMGEQPIPRPRRIRRVGIETLILRIFYTKRGNTPKKEYIRLRLIRGQKKGFRQALNNKLPTEHALHAFDPDNHQSMNL